MSNGTVTSSGTFIDTFCAVDSYSDLGSAKQRGISFSLREFSPCFNDVVVIGGSDICMIFFGLLRLYFLCSPKFAKYSMKGSTKLVQIVKIFLAFLAAVVSLIQLSGRIGATQNVLAPFEYVSFALGLVSFVFLGGLFAKELDAMELRTAWHLNFAVLLQLAGHTVKLYFLTELYETGNDSNAATDFFFGVFLVRYVCVAAIGLLALFYVPADSQFTKLAGRSELDDGADDQEKEDLTGETCPEQRSSCLSRYTFSWLNPLMTLGHKRPLDREDVWMLPKTQSAKFLSNQFLTHWEKETNADKPSLLRALRRTYLKDFLIAGCFKLFNDAAQFVGPIFIGLFIQFIASQKSANPIDQSVGYLYAVCIFLGQLIGALAENQYFQRIMSTGLHVRSVLISSIFKTAMSLSAKGRHGRSAGKMVNLMSSDSEGLQQATQGLWNAWSAPVRIVVALVLLYGQLQWATFVGVVMLACSVPVQKSFIGKSMKIFRASAKTTDERLKYQNELFGNMNVVKMYAWEDSFEDRVQKVRTEELDLLWKGKMLQIWNSFFITAIPILVTVVTFAVYSIWIGEMDAEKAFTSIAYFAVLRYPLIQLPSVINMIANAQVMVKRLEDFLMADVLEETPFQALPEGKENTPAVSIHPKAEFAWNIDQTDSSLSKAGIDISPGQFVSIIGGTGQGKSTMLSAMLGELPCISGHPDAARIYGSIAYVPQESWVFNATLRENILFGLPYDEVRYNKAVHVARMTRDLELMPAGDSTEIGEKGVNLSGGQRQRLSIARAVYADADVYLFDDPLSALDAKVAREVFDMCIRGHLKSKTIILVTNRVEFISSSDAIILMSEQQIGAKGTYKELLESSSDFRSMMQNIGDANEIDANDVEAETNADGEENSNGETKKASEQKKNEAVAKLIKKETRRKGNVSWDTINAYISAVGGKCVVFSLLFSYLLAEIFRLVSSYWLKFWSSDEFGLNGTTSYLSVYLGLFAFFSFCQTLVALVTQYGMSVAGMKGSKVMHTNMVSSLLRAPMSFFHANPHGRIINRFTKDISDIDKYMIMFTSLVLRSVVQLSGTLVIIGMQTPYTLLTFVPVMCVFFFVQRYFQETSRELKRLDATTRSPIYAHFSECLHGIANIRAYKRAKEVNNSLGLKLNSHLRMNLAQFSANRWLSVRLEFLGGSLVFFSCLFVVVGYQQIDASAAGMQLSFALQITSLLNMLVRLTSLAENSFNAVERIKEYSDVEQERPKADVNDNLLEGKWPQEGKIEYREVVARYRTDLPPVLKGLSFDIKPMEKVGLVGRTGAGKSSLFLTLFRIVERDDGAGSISIDGVDISSVGLKLLRDSISIIPQEPVLFVGTARFNLDPFDKYSDAEVWRALENAHMKKCIMDSGMGLDMIVEENGSNFSVGQRQLICLARALLKNSKILVLDEATAAVDVETDHLIQATIRKSFSHCSTLTIAHRLDTIIDSDRVLVLDNGKALEFDTPKELLTNPKYSEFAGMVKETGAETEKYLRSVAMGSISHEDELEQKLEETRASITESPRRLSRQLSLSGLELIEEAELSEMQKVQNALVVLRNALSEDGINKIKDELSSETTPGSAETEWFRWLVHNLSKLNNIVGQNVIVDFGDRKDSVSDAAERAQLLMFTQSV